MSPPRAPASADPVNLTTELLAFPTAEGYGKYTVGGRGGGVYEVTNLNDSGLGSLRHAVEASGPRTVVFMVSGTIDLKSNLTIENPFITIAGQTAPGDGITLKRYPLVIAADEVIVRYLRIRMGDEAGEDADSVSGRFRKNIILDHISASWSVDETVSLYQNENVTVQWSIISESLFNSSHPTKPNHGFGGIWGGNYNSYHHNLIAHHQNRTPRFASGSENNDFRNNVIYNWGILSVYGGEMLDVGDPRFSFSNLNVVANYYKPGPATIAQVRNRMATPWSRNGAADYGRWYIAGNVMEGSPAVTADNWDGGVVAMASTGTPQLRSAQEGEKFIAGLKADQPWPSMPIRQQTAVEAYESVLANAGATKPARDPVDRRIVAEVRGGYATYEGPTYEQVYKVVDPAKKSGIIDSPAEVGGWPVLQSAPAPQDTDHDGMPDAWERANGLNPKNSADRNRRAADGYTMLEKYLHSLE